ncbi:DUF3164 family protein [Thalassobius sp. I31.1]|uniref:DUF3164 family protein n=1 Tax=Thalassobius sp. I31.1 TaxID=2109912 RepID=UPI000D1BDEC7|nr:DUF3164 family protein [Thalassobius sp. I31.1]
MTAPSHDLIERPDGSLIAYDMLEPVKQLEHDLVTRLCTEAQARSEELKTYKLNAISEMVAARVMMLSDWGVKKGGKDGNLTLRSECRRWMVRLTVGKHISFGPEMEAAKELIFEVVEDEKRKSGSDFLSQIVDRVFSPNKKGRIDTQGILGLRDVECDDPRWIRAMEAIEQSILRDSATTYINFYKVNLHAKTRAAGETRISLNLAEV